MDLEVPIEPLVTICTFRYLLELTRNRHGLMVLTTLIVLTNPHGIELVLLNQTQNRGPSVVSMWDF